MSLLLPTFWDQWSLLQKNFFEFTFILYLLRLKLTIWKWKNELFKLVFLFGNFCRYSPIESVWLCTSMNFMFINFHITDTHVLIFSHWHQLLIIFSHVYFHTSEYKMILNSLSYTTNWIIWIIIWRRHSVIIFSSWFQNVSFRQALHFDNKCTNSETKNYSIFVTKWQ